MTSHTKSNSTTSALADLPQASAANEESVSRRRAPAASTKYAYVPVSDVESALQEQLQDDRLTQLRADMALRYIDDLQVPNYGDMWVPGYKLIGAQLAKEFGLTAFEDDPFSELPLDEPQPPSGAVDGNIIASFVDGVTGQQKNDVLNGCLLAQLAANAKFDRTLDPVPWTKYYGRVLENIGWVVPQFDFRSLHSSQTRFSIDSAIIKVITSIMTEDQIAVTQAALEALKNLNGEDRRATIFRRNAVNNTVGNFQVTNVGLSTTGVLSMRLGAFGFRTNESVTDVLWFSFSGGSTDLAVMRTTLVLNEQVFSQVRDAIVNKLGNRALNYIGGLELADA